MFKKTISLLLFLLLVTLATADSDQDCLFYFYGDECEDCQQIEPFIEDLKVKNPNLTVMDFEVYYNQQNNELLKQYLDIYNIEGKSLPIVFIGNSYFIGQKSITNLLEDRIKDNIDSACPALEKIGTVGVVGEGSPIEVLKILSFTKVSGSAFSDFFKPGALALFLVLLIVLNVTKNKEEMIKRGALYLLGIFLAYILFGIGLFDYFFKSSFTLVFSKIIGIIVIIFALVRIKAFFKTWELLLKSIPGDLKNHLRKILKLLLKPLGLIIVGFCFSLLTFSGANSTLMLIRSLFSEGYKQFMVFPILLYYILLFMLIPVMIIAFVYLIKNKFKEKAHQKGETKKEHWENHYSGLFDLAISLIILILGLIILFA